MDQNEDLNNIEEEGLDASNFEEEAEEIEEIKDDSIFGGIKRIIIGSGIAEEVDGFFRSDAIFGGSKFVIQLKQANGKKVEVNYVGTKDDKNIMPKGEVALYVRNKEFAKIQNDAFKRYQSEHPGDSPYNYVYEVHSIRKTVFYKATGEIWTPDNLNAKNRFSTFRAGIDDKFIFEAVQAILFSVGQADNLHTKVRNGIDEFLSGPGEVLDDELVENLNKLILTGKDKISKETWQSFFTSDNWGPTLKSIKHQKVIGKDSEFFKDSAKLASFLNEIDKNGQKYRGNTYYCVHPNLKFGQSDKDRVQGLIEELIGIKDTITPADIYYVSSNFFDNNGYYVKNIQPHLKSGDEDALRGALNQAFLDMQAFGISLKQTSGGGEIDLVNGKSLVNTNHQIEVKNPSLASDVLMENKIRFISDTNIEDDMTYYPPFRTWNGEKSARSTLMLNINGGIIEEPFKCELTFMKCNEGRGSDVTLQAKGAVARFGSAKGALSELFNRLIESAIVDDDPEDTGGESIELSLVDDNKLREVTAMLERYYEDARKKHGGEGIMELRKHADCGASVAAWQFFKAISTCNVILRKAMVAFFISYVGKYELILSDSVKDVIAGKNTKGVDISETTVIDSSMKALDILKQSEKKVIYFKYH